ncbi:MAG: DNA-directed RNA polymerase subunit alpha [Candidatus Sumerlaeia bacterium]|nr:DNA-directed RNA polymerase subunit alpha [Candidatus Sumerlaeia bacterium]
MELELKPLIRPTRLIQDKLTLTDTFGRFTVEPLERGFGTTIGNSLRRILLSSIQGAAATSVRFEGVRHEFMAVPGAREDVNDIILNIKQVVFKLDADLGSTNIVLSKKGPGKVTAADFELPDGLTILNPGQHIAELTGGTRLEMEVLVASGRGYMPAVYPEMEDEDDIGILPIDAVFSPIRKVRYEVSDARVGQQTDYDRLVLEVSTNGSVRPEEAVSFAAKILRDHLDLFIRIEDRDGAAIGEDRLGGGADGEAGTPIQTVLDKSIEELELSVRSYNCLEAAGIKTIRDLVQKSESEMLKYRNFGRKSLSEIKAILKQYNLSFGIKFDESGNPVKSAHDDKD